MAVKIPEELAAFGITSKEFVEKKRGLAKSADAEVSDNDVIWELFQALTKKALSYEMLQMLFWNMAIFKDKLGQNSFEYQQKSHKSRLLDLEQKGKTKVKINATGCSASCRKLHNLVLPLEKALHSLPVPNPKCEATLYSENTWCTSIYLVAKESEKESPKLPPAVENVPEIPHLAKNSKNNASDSADKSAETLAEQAKENTLAWLLSALTFSMGLGLLFFFTTGRRVADCVEYSVFSSADAAFASFFTFFKTPLGTLESARNWVSAGTVAVIADSVG
jgi:hypothetical protein